jgi:hypothetical protein
MGVALAEKPLPENQSVHSTRRVRLERRRSIFVREGKV